MSITICTRTILIFLLNLGFIDRIHSGYFFLFSACNHFSGVCELSHPVSSVGMFTLSYILSLFGKLYLTYAQMSGCSVHLMARPALLPLLQRSPLRMPSTFSALWQWNPRVCILLSAFSFVRFSVLLLIAKLSHLHLWTQYHFTVRLQFIISSTLEEHSVVSSLGLSPLNIFVCVQFCWVDTHLASHTVSGSSSLIKQVGECFFSLRLKNLCQTMMVFLP